MARHNVAVVLSPVHRAGTVQDEEDRGGDEVNGISLISTEDELAAVLNSASKKKATSPINTGSIGVVPGAIGWGDRVQTEPEHSPRDDSNVGRKRTSGPPEAIEGSTITAAPTEPAELSNMPSTSTIPSTSEPKKRKLPAVKDVYEIELSPERDRPTEAAYGESQPKRVKRGRPPKGSIAFNDWNNIKGQHFTKEQSVVAEKETTKPRRGRPPKVQAKDTKNKVEDESPDEPTSESPAGKSPTLVENGEASILESDRPAPAKVGRGRPRKAQLKRTDKQVTVQSPNERAHESTTSMPKAGGESPKQKTDNSMSTPSKAPVVSKIIMASNRISVTPELGSLLQNPSPIKAVSPLKLKRPQMKALLKPKSPTREVNLQKVHQGSIRGIATDPNSVQDEAPTSSIEQADIADIELETPEAGIQNAEEEIEEEAEDNLQRAGQAIHSQSASSRPEEHIVDPMTLEKILEKLRNVGHSFDQQSNTWKRVRKQPTLYTVPAKRLQKMFGHLNTTYQEIQVKRAAEEVANLNEALAKTGGYIEALQRETINILRTRFGHVENKDESRTQRTLTDLYFNILPNFVEVLKNGVKAYSCGNHLATPKLKEVADIIEMIHDLAETATREPKEVQPKAGKGHSYRFQRPTREVIPELRRLQKACRIELSLRERKENIAKARREAPERERLRKEREAIEEEERRKRNEWKVRMQKETFAKNMDDPWMNNSAFASQAQKPPTQYAVASSQRCSQSQASLEHLAQRKAHTAEQVRILKSRLSEAEHLDQEANLAYERELQKYGYDDDSFENDDREERVHLFGGENNHASSNMKEWSAREKTTLIDILRVRRGQPDLYEKLAEKLDRSMDEIFEKVKDFKEAMEICREHGRFLESEHDWIDEI